MKKRFCKNCVFFGGYNQGCAPGDSICRLIIGQTYNSYGCPCFVDIKDALPLIITNLIKKINNG